MGIFKILFCLSCIYKFSIETYRGYFNYLAKDSFLNFVNDYSSDITVYFLSERIYKFLYLVKWVAIVLLLIGIIPRACALYLVLWFFIESRIYFKFHTTLFCLIALILAISPSPSLEFNPLNNSVPTQVNPLSQFLLLITIVVIYLVTASRKLGSKSFRSGEVILRTMQFLEKEKLNRKYIDSFYPNILKKYLLHEKSLIYWKLIIGFTILSHILIPILLLSNSTIIYGACLGILLHAGYTVFYPVTLIHFSTVMISSYIAFIDPQVIDDIIINNIQ